MKRLGIALLLSVPSVASAEIRPTPGVGDPRIQTVLYDPEQVVQLQVAVGYELTLEFGPDERIENIAVGDSGAWQVTPNKRGDHLFIKAGQNGAATNMTVVTDTRTYSFVLTPAYGASSDLAFTVRFRFAPVATAAVVSGDAAVPEIGRYRLSGVRAIRPSAMDDDGVHTYIEWPPGQTMPAVFAVDAQGEETLVNGMVRDHRYVIDSISSRLVFRLGTQIAYATRRVRKAR
ncbi:TrbG/VirB9 family P-type conjugative transfer protein [Sphingomonas sp.]|uniref:TrbG/VirB9 family P-type conjugative transfer protein n=1 Tax=Sphingomonas sp. TaxID=28214 RepID=UPI003563C7DF